MTRTTRTAARAAAGALTLAFALGAGASATAAAAPQDRPSHASKDATVKGQRAVLIRIAVLDARLLRAVGENRTSGLDADVRSRLADNISADRDSLSVLAAGVMDNPAGNLAVARETLRSLRVANYLGVVNTLRHAQKVSLKVAEAQAALAGDPNAPVADLEAASAALQSVVADAGDITGFSSKREVREVRSALSAAQAALGRVQAYRASLEAPAEEEPVDEPVMG